jgi:hypothetical protein
LNTNQDQKWIRENNVGMGVESWVAGDLGGGGGLDDEKKNYDIWGNDSGGSSVYNIKQLRNGIFHN